MRPSLFSFRSRIASGVFKIGMMSPLRGAFFVDAYHTAGAHTLRQARYEKLLAADGRAKQGAYPPCAVKNSYLFLKMAI